MNSREYWKQGVLGSSLTSMKVGGEIRYYYPVQTVQDLADSVKAAKEEGIPFRIIGGGSNLIISDEGYQGLLIQPKFSTIRIIEGEEARGFTLSLENALPPGDEEEARYKPNRGSGNVSENLLSLKEEKDPEGEPVLVEVGAGVPWGQVVAWSLSNNLVGLHRFARIPCHMGGALYNNIHGGGRLLGEWVVGAYVYDTTLDAERFIDRGELQLGYDTSILHERRELIVTKVLLSLTRVSPADGGIISERYREWTKEKARVQPSGANCGSVFQNLLEKSPSETPLAAAWYIDQCGLKGKRVGGMRVYEGHANFIINSGEGTQKDFIRLVKQIQETVEAKFGIWLQPEVECIDVQGKPLVFTREASETTEGL